MDPMAMRDPHRVEDQMARFTASGLLVAITYRFFGWLLPRASPPCEPQFLAWDDERMVIKEEEEEKPKDIYNMVRDQARAALRWDSLLHLLSEDTITSLSVAFLCLAALGIALKKLRWTQVMARHGPFIVAAEVERYLRQDILSLVATVLVQLAVVAIVALHLGGVGITALVALDAVYRGRLLVAGVSLVVLVLYRSPWFTLLVPDVVVENLLWRGIMGLLRWLSRHPF